MRNRCIQMCILILLGILLYQNILAGQKVRYQFEKGNIYRYSTTVESNTTGQMMGQEFSMTSGAAIDYSISVTDAKEGVYTLTLTFEKFHVRVNMPMMGFHDSTMAMEEYVGKRMKIVMTDRGKTLSTALIDTIAPSRIQAMAGLTPADLFKQFLIELPEKEMDKNSSWKKDLPDTTQRGGMKIVTRNNIEFNVAGSEEKLGFECWKIAILGTSTIEGSGSRHGNDVTMDGTIKVSGAAYVAPAEGVFVLSEQINDTEMTTMVTGAQTGASTMSISTTMKTELVK